MSQTVLLTGITGFIAKHIALKLLNAGHTVKGSARSLSRIDEVRDALRPHLAPGIDLDARLSIVALDLGSDDGWDDAMAGVDVLMHTASPFPLSQPKDADAVIRPAVDGTLRALGAAQRAGVTRVVLTSSTVAVTVGNDSTASSPLDEGDWSRLDHPEASPYARSKTMAEQAAWDFVAAHPEMALTVINPGFVVGPALDGNYGTSLQVVERVLRARDPMLPRVGFAAVDVRDVAEAHLRALETERAEGERFLVVAGFLWFSDIARIVAGKFPDRKVVTREAPNLVVRVLGLFDRAIRSILPSLGKRMHVSNAKAQERLGLDFHPLDQAVGDAAASVLEYRDI